MPDYSAGDLLIEYKEINGERRQCYKVIAKKFFNPISSFRQDDVELCFEHAYDMAYGTGWHRAHRTGGIHQRKRGEIFADTFQGKLAEFAVYRYLESKNVEATLPDLEIYGEDEWDVSDIDSQGKHLAIKSTKAKGNLLLLETEDWNRNGEYCPNLMRNRLARYDYFVFTRIDSNGNDVSGIMKVESMLYLQDDSIPDNIRNILYALLCNRTWKYDIPGFIYHSELVRMISEGRIIPQNAILNYNPNYSKQTVMDAENYYFQAGNMHNSKELFTYNPDENPDGREYLIRKCPECGGRLVVRKQRANPANRFWGCENYSRCMHSESL